MRSWKVVKLCAVVLSATGCPGTSPPPLPEAGPVAAAPDAGPIVPLALDLLVALPDGGTERHALLGLETPLVFPSRQLLVESNRPLHNARIRVLDEQDRALASDDVPEQTPTALRYHIDLLQPLDPGHRYAVLVDAQSGATFDDGSGKEVPEQRLEFRTSGERERARPPPPHRKRRHR
ncbi:MAG TPA: hypothetical protein VFE93_19300 [Myxococcaceae bacterium]|jgi:hypothetical protein|nr:hypothetical protein [Myxococcaceae bacterium]